MKNQIFNSDGTPFHGNTRESTASNEFISNHALALGVWKEDDYDPIYEYSLYNGWTASISHFWRADLGENSLNSIGTRNGVPNAYTKARRYINGYDYFLVEQVGIGSFDNNIATYMGLIYDCPSVTNIYAGVDFYKKGYRDATTSNDYILHNYVNCNPWVLKKNFAYNILGRIAHLLGDMSVPAHAHNHEHPCPASKPDFYENYLGGVWGSGSTPLPGLNWNPGFTLNWNCENYPGGTYPAKSWTALTARKQGGLIINETGCVDFAESCKYLFYTMNQLADWFPSGSNAGAAHREGGNSNLPMGTNPYINQRYLALGPSSSMDPDIYKIGDECFNYVIRATATLLYNFANATGQLATPISAKTVSCGCTAGYSSIIPVFSNMHYQNSVVNHLNVGKNNDVFVTDGTTNGMGGRLLVDNNTTLNICNSTNLINKGPFNPSSTINGDIGNIVLGNSTGTNYGIIRVQYGSTLVLKNNSILAINNNSKLIIEAGGKLKFESGAQIKLIGLNSIIEIQNEGVLEIGADATFTFSGLGFIRFNDNGASKKNIIVSGPNAKFILTGSLGVYNQKVLEITGDESLYPADNLALFSINNGTIKLDPNTRIRTATALTLINVKMVCSQIDKFHRGINVFGQRNILINNLNIENASTGITSLNYIGGNDILIKNTNIINSGTAIKIEGGGIQIENVSLTNNSVGIQAYLLTRTSKIQSLKSKNNFNDGFISSTNNIVSINQSTFTGDIINNIYGTAHGLQFENCDIKVACSVFSNHYYEGIFPSNGSTLEMDPTFSFGVGKNQVSNNRFNVYGNVLRNLYLNNSNSTFIPNNLLSSKSISAVIIQQTPTDIPANFNVWNRSFSGPIIEYLESRTTPNGTGTIKHVTDGSQLNYMPSFSGCDYIIVGPGGGQGVMKPSSYINENYPNTYNVYHSNGKSIASMVAIGLNYLYNNDSIQSNTNNIIALNSFCEILLDTTLQNKQVNIALDKIYLKMLEALNLGLESNQIQVSNESGATLPTEAQKVIEVQNKLLSLINQSKIENDSFYYYKKYTLSLDKALIYKMFNDRSTSINQLEYIATWCDQKSIKIVNKYLCLCKKQDKVLSSSYADYNYALDDTTSNCNSGNDIQLDSNYIDCSVLAKNTSNTTPLNAQIKLSKTSAYTQNMGATSIQLKGYTTNADSFTWYPTTWLNRSDTLNVISTPQDTITYILTAYKNGCIATDTAHIKYNRYTNAGYNDTLCYGNTETLIGFPYDMSLFLGMLYYYDSTQFMHYYTMYNTGNSANYFRYFTHFMHDLNFENATTPCPVNLFNVFTSALDKELFFKKGWYKSYYQNLTQFNNPGLIALNNFNNEVMNNLSLKVHLDTLNNWGNIDPCMDNLFTKYNDYVQTHLNEITASWSRITDSDTITLSSWNNYFVAIDAPVKSSKYILSVITPSVAEIDEITILIDTLLTPLYASEMQIDSTVYFMNYTEPINNATHYEWNFGDGSINSFETNPIHTFPAFDSNYFVCLNTINKCGTNIYCDTIRIDANYLSNNLNREAKYSRNVLLQNNNNSETKINSTHISNKSLRDSEFVLANYPNPFNNSTTIDYQIGQYFTDAELRITNILGQTIFIQKLKKSRDKIIIDGTNLPNGIYYYSIIIDGALKQTKTMSLIH